MTRADLNARRVPFLDLCGGKAAGRISGPRSQMERVISQLDGKIDTMAWQSGPERHTLRHQVLKNSAVGT
jgi:hypothetical protein